jgi:hypothetical protein
MSEETQFDEVFDTQLDVKANPSGAWRAIQSQHAEITRLRAENKHLEAKLAKALAILRDAERLCAEGHPVSALNLALAILAELEGKGDE